MGVMFEQKAEVDKKYSTIASACSRKNFTHT
jgi:hypothetical protein